MFSKIKVPFLLLATVGISGKLWPKAKLISGPEGKLWLARGETGGHLDRKNILGG